jgi:hypothetical protein
MRDARFCRWALLLLTITTTFTSGCSALAHAQNITALCNPQIVANKVVVTATQREAAGDIAQPPLTDQANGFAWPDTPLGVVKTDDGYAFFDRAAD